MLAILACPQNSTKGAHNNFKAQILGGVPPSAFMLVAETVPEELSLEWSSEGAVPAQCAVASSRDQRAQWLTLAGPSLLQSKFLGLNNTHSLVAMSNSPPHSLTFLPVHHPLSSGEHTIYPNLAPGPCLLWAPPRNQCAQCPWSWEASPA